MKVFHALVGAAVALPIATTVSAAQAHGGGAQAPLSAPAFGGVHGTMVSPLGGFHGTVVSPPPGGGFHGTVATPHQFWGTVAHPHFWGTPVPRVPALGTVARPSQPVMGTIVKPPSDIDD
jgi:hypothetical protein